MKDKKKLDSYNGLRHKDETSGTLEQVVILPNVSGTLQFILKRFKDWLKKLEVNSR